MRKFAAPKIFSSILFALQEKRRKSLGKLTLDKEKAARDLDALTWTI